MGATRVFKSKPFSRFASHAAIEDRDLCDSVHRAERGLIDADLGGGVIKQRLAREAQGRSGGFRSIVLFRRADKAFFVYGFAKNDRDNIGWNELMAFRKLAALMLAYDERELGIAMSNNTIVEIMCDGPTVS